MDPRMTRVPGPNDRGMGTLEERPHFEQLGEVIHDNLSLDFGAAVHSPLDEPFLGAEIHNEGVVVNDEGVSIHSQIVTMANGKRLQIDVYELN